MAVENELDQVVEGAKRVLANNSLGKSTKPSPALYPHQWNWDSCFIAIGYSRYDTARAMQEIRSLLRGQWHNGMVPQIIFNPEGTGYFPGPDVWQSTRSPQAPRQVMTSGITQPPVLATACLAIYVNAPAGQKDEARAFLSDIYPHLLAYHGWFYAERNPDGDGLLVVVHPWEAGLDNSPVYLEAGKRVHLTYKPVYHREDTAHVSARYRPTDKDYDLYVYLLELMRADDWDQRRYLEHAPLQVQDVLFNSVLCRANRDLAEIAGIVGADPEPAKQWRQETADAVNARLWNEDDGMYYSRDRITKHLIQVETVEGLQTMYGGVATPARAERLIGIHLANPREFWPSFPIPTTALDSSYFNPENYWLGPAWVNTNWMAVHGLVNASRSDLAATLTTHTLDMVRRSGFREYYNPLTGEGYGTDDFSWTAALTIDLIAAMDTQPRLP